MFFLLAIYTGMRRGELLALTWKDIDFDNKRILVNKSLVKTEKGLFKAATKTKSSNRSISISSFVIGKLQSYYSYKKKEFFRWGIHLNEEAFIFTGNTMHSPLHIDAPHRFLNDHYKKLVFLEFVYTTYDTLTLHLCSRLENTLKSYKIA